jgi:hypothetical protein
MLNRRPDASGDKRHNKTMTVQNFLVLFMRLQAVLFEATISSPEETPTKTLNTLSHFFSKHQHTILSEFENLLNGHGISDLLLLRIVVISMFSVHFAIKTDPAPDSVCKSMSLCFLFSMVKTIAGRVADDRSSRNKRSYIARLVPALTVFADWTACHPNLMTPHTVTVTAGSEEADTTAELFRKENRTRSSMRSALASTGAVVDALLTQTKPPPITTGQSIRPYLAEHIELYGFPPLATVLDVSTSVLCIDT